MQHVSQVRVRIHARQHAAVDNREVHRRRLRSSLAAGEQPVLASRHRTPERELAGVVVDRHLGVVHEHREAVPLVVGVLQRSVPRAPRLRVGKVLVDEGPEVPKPWDRARLAHALTLIRDKQDDQGRWPLEYSYTGKIWNDFGAKKQPNKWVTLRALRVLKAAA